MVKNSYVLFSICILFLSCKKEIENADNDVVFPLTIFSKSIDSKTAFKLYTKDGEVTNSAIKNRFKKNSAFYNLEDSKLNPNEALTFISPDTAIFTNSMNQKFTVEKHGSIFLLHSTTQKFYSNNDFIHDIFKYQSIRQPLSPAIGFDYRTKEIKVTNGSYSNLKLSILSYLLQRGDADNRSLHYGTVHNEFDRASLSRLNANDTLAIQEYRLTLRAK